MRKKSESESDLFGLIKKQAPAIERALPKHIPEAAFTRAAVTVLRKSPKLQKCSGVSVLASLMEAAQVGLYMGSGAAAEAFLVPYKGEATFQIGYRGFLSLLYRSGKVANVRVGVIHEKDRWSHVDGMSPRLRITPSTEMNPGELIAAWCVIEYTNGTSVPTVVYRRDIERARKASMASDSPAWSLWYDRMAIKTAIKRACQTAPRQVELEAVHRAVEADDAPVEPEPIEEPLDVQEVPQGDSAGLSDEEKKQIEEQEAQEQGK